MSINNTLKHLLFLCPLPVRKYFYEIYNIVKYPGMAEKKMCGGKYNKGDTVYIIRPRTDGIEGLMALMLNVLKQISYAERKGYVPVVDFQNYRTQYSDQLQEEKNAWEYYFKTVSNLSIEDAYRSADIRLSGLNALSKCDPALDQKFDSESIKIARDFVHRYIRFSDHVIEKVKEEETLFSVRNSIGLYLRGTDYVKLRPAGHPIQPTAQQAIEITDNLLKKYHLKDVFLVTEDEEIYEKVKRHYGEKLHIVSYDSFIIGYSGKAFLSQNTSMLNQLADTPYSRGLNYLCKLILLSHCKCFVGGNTCGSWAACAFSTGYIEQYIFDLGKY